MSVDARYGIDDSPVFVIDQSRCIGCRACVQACVRAWGRGTGAGARLTRSCADQATSWALASRG